MAEIDDALVEDLYSDMAYAYVYVLPRLKPERRPPSITSWGKGHVREWSLVLRPHFKPPKGACERAPRRHLETADPDADSFVPMQDDPINWRNYDYACDAFEWCFLQIEQFVDQAELTGLLAPMIQLAEDHLPKARLTGVRCLHHTISLASSLLIRMGLADLSLQIFKVNLAFPEHPDLLIATLAGLKALMESGWKPKFSKPYFAALDPFLEILLKDITLCRDEAKLGVLMAGMREIVELEALGSVRYLPTLIEVIFEIANNVKDAGSVEGCRGLFETVGRVCKPRMHRYQQQCDDISRTLFLITQ